MKCPHCLVQIHADPSLTYISDDVDGQWVIQSYECPNPECQRLFMYLLNGKFQSLGQGHLTIIYKPNGQPDVRREYLIYPKGSNRAPAPPDVPRELAEDYMEACIVLSDSLKASAALSRRCLQNILKDQGTTKRDLSDQIEEVLEKKELPTWLADELHNIREIGNFAAHPNKSKVTGEILQVEPGEAEANLDVLEGLFDFYYVQPAAAKKRKEALNKKLGR